MMISDKLRDEPSESKLDFTRPASIGLDNGHAHVAILTNMGVKPCKPTDTCDQNTSESSRDVYRSVPVHCGRT